MLNQQVLAFGSLDGQWKISDGQMTYKVFHVMHNAEVTNSHIDGVVSCQKDHCQIQIQADLKDFKSAEPKRDETMLFTTKADKFPIVKITGEVKNIIDEKAFVDITIELAGQTHSYQKVETKFDKKWKEILASGSLEISLQDFKMKAPELIGIAIQDKVLMTFKLKFKNPEQKLF